MKARNPKNREITRKKINLVKESNEAVWMMLEYGESITDGIEFYDDSGEIQLSVDAMPDEQIYYCDTPYDNYAITDMGRVWSFKMKKFIKTFYRPNSVICYMNIPITRNVKVSKLFEMAGWKYEHNKITQLLDNFNLLIHDYNGKKKN